MMTTFNLNKSQRPPGDVSFLMFIYPTTPSLIGKNGPLTSFRKVTAMEVAIFHPMFHEFPSEVPCHVFCQVLDFCRVLGTGKRVVA